MSASGNGNAANAIAGLMAEMSEALAPIEEAARGYRDRLKTEHGWNDKAAQEIATAYFRLMVTIFQTNM